MSNSTASGSAMSGIFGKMLPAIKMIGTMATITLTVGAVLGEVGAVTDFMDRMKKVQMSKPITGKIPAFDAMEKSLDELFANASGVGTNNM